MLSNYQLYIKKSTLEFADLNWIRTFADGKLAEWSNAAVLKTVDCHRSGGSNPSLSASKRKKSCIERWQDFLVYK